MTRFVLHANTGRSFCQLASCVLLRPTVYFSKFKERPELLPKVFLDAAAW
jgi:hypothetical protein